MSDDAQREAFEAWAATKGYDEAGMKRKGETYRYNVPRTWWEAWLASAARFDAVVGVLKNIRDDYDCDQQVREHTEGYGGICRSCLAGTALRALAPTTNQQGAP